MKKKKNVLTHRYEKNLFFIQRKSRTVRISKITTFNDYYCRYAKFLFCFSVKIIYFSRQIFFFLLSKGGKKCRWPQDYNIYIFTNIFTLKNNCPEKLTSLRPRRFSQLSPLSHCSRSPFVPPRVRSLPSLANICIKTRNRKSYT